MWYMEFLGGLVVRACCGLAPIPGLGTETPHQAGACRSCKKEKKKDIWSSPVVQEVRDLALSLLWLWSQL